MRFIQRETSTRRRWGMALAASSVGILAAGVMAGLAPQASAAPAETPVSTFAELQTDFATTGSYQLTADLTNAGGYLTVGIGQGVALDLNGHTLTITDVPASTAAIVVPQYSLLVIEDNAGGGTLTAEGGAGGAGIGGVGGFDGTAGSDGGPGAVGGTGGTGTNAAASVGAVQILSGTVNATGGAGAAGIGGGAGGRGGAGGTGGNGTDGAVDANGTVGWPGGPGGDGGAGGSGGSVTISGGTVTATGGTGAPGIGGGGGGLGGAGGIGGNGGNGGNGGVGAGGVGGTGGPGGVGGAGGAAGSGGAVTISGGTVTASGGVGIGGGAGGNGGAGADGGVGGNGGFGANIPGGTGGAGGRGGIAGPGGYGGAGGAGGDAAQVIVSGGSLTATGTSGTGIGGGAGGAGGIGGTGGAGGNGGDGGAGDTGGNGGDGADGGPAGYGGDGGAGGNTLTPALSPGSTITFGGGDGGNGGAAGNPGAFGLGGSGGTGTVTDGLAGSNGTQGPANIAGAAGAGGTVLPTAPTFTAASPPLTATVGTAYSYKFIASGNPTPTYSVASGGLPSGLALNPTTGVLSGSPSGTGSFTFTVGATNGSGADTAGPFTIAVSAAAVPPASGCTTAPYPDVPTSNPFCVDISWLKNQNITGGYPDGGFHPTTTVTRQAIAAFLYRLQNPSATTPTCTSAPYPDVPTTSQFCGDITWMKNQNITGGYPDGDFHPTADVTRQAIAAFLYRLQNAGQTVPACTSAPYPDVPTTNLFCGDISWLKSQNITGGYPDGGFHPTADVTRQAIAAFLHRLRTGA